MKKMLPHELQIAAVSKKYPNSGLTNLNQYLTEELLTQCYKLLNRRSSPGVDGQTWQDYQQESEERLPRLLSEIKSGQYRAPHIRRVYIDKADGGQRPLGIPTIEDKVAQSAIRSVMEPIYETEFKDFSYGYRRDRSAHQALDELFTSVSFGKMRTIIDADIEDFFGSMDHRMLRDFVETRVKDGVILRMLGKWLKSGVLEGEELTYPEKGTPQGGLISPLLSNIYLHYVLDEWFSEQIQPLLKGNSFMIRYADDFVMGFEHPEDAAKVMKVLPNRLSNYHLRLHARKTRVVNLSEGDRGDRSFTFLGFTHYGGKSRKGHWILKRKTSSKKLSSKITEIGDWIKVRRHKKLGWLVKRLNARLRGHYNYYGITHNSQGIIRFYRAVERLLQKWINRRGGKRKWTWQRIGELKQGGNWLLKPKIQHSYLKANTI